MFGEEVALPARLNGAGAIGGIVGAHPVSPSGANAAVGVCGLLFERAI